MSVPKDTSRRRTKGTGSLTERAPGVWRLRAFAGTDPATGRPRQVARTVHGSRKEAQAELNRLLEEVAQGRHDTAAGSVGHLLDEYLRHLRAKGRERSTLEAYEGHIRRRIRPAIGRVPLRKLTAKHLDDLYAACLEDLAPVTVQGIHAIISGALSQAVKWDWIPYSVAPKASPPEGSSPEAAWPSAEEFVALAMAAYTGLAAPDAPADGRRPHTRRCFLEPDLDLGAAILLCALTGCRRGELVALSWPDVDWSEPGELTIRHQWVWEGGEWVLKALKTKRPRTITLGTRGLLLLADHQARMMQRCEILGHEFPRRGWVLSPDGGYTPYRPTTMATNITALGRRLGMEVHTHSLRHYSATQLIAAGFDPVTVAKRHGHSRPSITLDIYSHAVPQRDVAAAEHMGLLLPVIDVPSLPAPDAKKPAAPGLGDPGTAGELEA